MRALAPLFKNGGSGVTGFFVVSGFLITRLLLQGHRGTIMPLREFYVRRAARIFPLLFLTVLLGIIISILWQAPSPHVDFCFRNGHLAEHPGFWLSIVTFTFNWYGIFFQHGQHLGLHWAVLWSLAVEEQFYLFYPFFLHRLSGYRLTMFLMLAVFAALVYRFWLFWTHPNDLILGQGTFAAFDALALGAGAFMLGSRIGTLLQKKPSQAVLLSGLGLLIAFWSYFTCSQLRPADNVLGPFLLALGCALFLVGGSSIPEKFTLWLIPLSWVGSLSYGLYLLHTSVYFFFPYVQGPIHSFDGWSLVYWVLLLITAWVSHRFFEMPVNRWIRRLLGEPSTVH